MTKRTEVLRYGVRSLAGLLGAGIAAAVVGALCVIPLPGFTATARSELVTPTPTDQRLVCPGSLLDILSMNGDTSTFAAVGVPDVFTQAQDTSITQSSMGTPDVATGDSATAPQVLFAPAPTTDVQPLISGDQSQSIGQETLSGLAAAPCVDSSTDIWLVGGSTDTWRTTLLLLNNPTEVAANVNVAIFAENGPVTGPGGTGIVVEPGVQRVISLASIAPGVSAPVVHVTSSGGQVVATLQQSVVRTLLPDGVDFVTPSAAPNVSLVIPGVRLSGMATTHASEGGEVSSDEQPAVRVGVPGTADAEVTVTAYSAQTKPVTVKAKIPAGRVLELPFGEMDDGIYSLLVSSTKPVVAAARTIQTADVDPFASSTATPTPVGTKTAVPTPTKPATASPSPTPGARGSSSTTGTGPALASLDDVSGGDVGTGGATPGGSSTYVAPAPKLGGDFTWLGSTLPVVGTTLVNVPEAPHPTLTLFNPTKSDVVVDLTQDGEQVAHLKVAAGSMQVVDVVAGTKYVMQSDQQIYGSLTFISTGKGASIPLNPSSPLAGGILVFPR